MGNTGTRIAIGDDEISIDNLLIYAKLMKQELEKYTEYNSHKLMYKFDYEKEDGSIIHFTTKHKNGSAYVCAVKKIIACIVQIPFNIDRISGGNNFIMSYTINSGKEMFYSDKIIEDKIKMLYDSN